MPWPRCMLPSASPAAATRAHPSASVASLYIFMAVLESWEE